MTIETFHDQSPRKNDAEPDREGRGRGWGVCVCVGGEGPSLLFTICICSKI